ADRAYVLTIIGANARSRKERLECIEEAKTIADGLPTLADRIDHYELISIHLADVDASASRKFLEDAFRLALKGEGRSFVQRRRSLVELACRTFPDAAPALVAAADDDPAKRRMEAQLRTYRIRDALTARKKNLELPVVQDAFE